MRLRAALVGDLRQVLHAQRVQAEQSVREAVDVCAVGLKQDMRQQVLSAGLGQRLANTFRSRVYENRGQPFGAAGFVWSKAPHVALGQSGAEITAHGGRYLAIPLPAAGRARGGKRITPQEWERAHGIKLRFVPRRGAAPLLVADNARLTKLGRAAANISRRQGTAFTRTAGRTTVPIFVLLKRVSLRKRLDLHAAAAAWAARLPTEIDRHWRSEEL